MRIALLGATGRLGAAVLGQALTRGHAVRCLARRAERLGSLDGLEAIEGDVRDPDAIAGAIAGTDASVCTLGSASGALVGPVARLLVAAAPPGHRVVCVTALGTGASRASLPLPLRVLSRLPLAYLRDKDDQEAVLRASGADWTLVRVSQLRSQPATGAIRVGADGEVPFRPTTFEDVAAFLVGELEVPAWRRAAVCVAGA